MFYFITKVILKNYNDSPNEILSKHTTITHTHSLENAIKLVKTNAFEYVVKKNRKLFDKTGSPHTAKRTHTYTMKCHPMNKHIIEIYKTFQASPSGWWGESEYKEDKVGYFCYTPYDGDGNLSETKEEPKETQSVRPITGGGRIIRNNEQHSQVIQELTKNNRFLKKRTKHKDTIEKDSLHDLDTFISGLTILND